MHIEPLLSARRRGLDGREVVADHAAGLIDGHGLAGGEQKRYADQG
jgi:hypothetical protein